MWRSSQDFDSIFPTENRWSTWAPPNPSNQGVLMPRNLLLLFLTAIFVATVNIASAQKSVILHVDVAADNHPIDPNIYGIASGVDSTFAQQIRLPNVRWGGDATTRYNWENDGTNSGYDWFFMTSGTEGTTTPGGQVDSMIQSYKPAGAKPLITIPIIPWISYAGNNDPKTGATCSFPVYGYGGATAYGPQLINPNFNWPGSPFQYNPFVNPYGDECGWGLDPNSPDPNNPIPILDTNITWNHVENTPAIQTAWLQHLASTWGIGRHGVQLFQLDNEPYGWGNTHRDVMPAGATYDQIIELGQQYASGLKKAHPKIQILGPSDFTLGGWLGDQTQQNGLFAGQYYLQRMANYEKENHVRLLDYFDEHFYGGNGGGVANCDATELESTRALWDPTFNSGTWLEQWFFKGPMRLIPRFKSWTDKYYPGTKLAITEYGWGCEDSIYGALALTDALGIYGREGLDLADIFSSPDPTGQSNLLAYPFLLYRNYDGKGGEYGDVWVKSTSSNQSEVSVYGAIRSKDKALTLVIVNKSANDITASVRLANFKDPGTCAEFFYYSGANLNQIVKGNDIPIAQLGNTAKRFKATFPALSASIVVLRRER